MQNLEEFMNTVKYDSAISDAFKIEDESLLAVPDPSYLADKVFYSGSFDKEVHAAEFKTASYTADVTLQKDIVYQRILNEDCDADKLVIDLENQKFRSIELPRSLKSAKTEEAKDKIINEFLAENQGIKFDLTKVEFTGACNYFTIRFVHQNRPIYTPLIKKNGKKFEFYDTERELRQYFRRAMLYGLSVLGALGLLYAID
ncbi:hypothetical protein ECANGB1_54 [Enterospora canceri]|uniref:Uncharacterized protein n=1 Tax=Enterospora canceri TaxID=1081671 RepID=A0A1Y1S8I5_9MICR|nr:hypothetical protein ECANGB1_54 [Enterospora canceri]